MIRDMYRKWHLEADEWKQAIKWKPEFVEVIDYIFQTHEKITLFYNRIYSALSDVPLFEINNYIRERDRFWAHLNMTKKVCSADPIKLEIQRLTLNEEIVENWEDLKSYAAAMQRVSELRDEV